MSIYSENITPFLSQIFRQSIPPCRPGDVRRINAGRFWSTSMLRMTYDPEGGYRGMEADSTLSFGCTDSVSVALSQHISTRSNEVFQSVSLPNHRQPRILGGQSTEGDGLGVPANPQRQRQWNEQPSAANCIMQKTDKMYYSRFTSLGQSKPRLLESWNICLPYRAQHGQVQNSSILFVDDCITSGTTARLCYEALVELGNHVDGLIWVSAGG